jgi:hypothetical protein
VVEPLGQAYASVAPTERFKNAEIDNDDDNLIDRPNDKLKMPMIIIIIKVNVSWKH